MRRIIYLRSILVLGGFTAACSSSVSIDEARRAAVVSVDGVTLDGATLEDILLAAPGNAGPSRETANLITSAFIDAALFRKALMGQVTLTDSATIAAIIEPDAIRGIVRGYLASLAMSYPPPTDEAVDSVTRLGQVRAFQVIAVRLPTESDSAAIDAFRTRVLGIYQEASADSADFTSLVRRYGEDSTLAASDGQFPAMRRSVLPSGSSYDAVWELSYGDVGQPVVLPPYAMIFRRDDIAESRPAVRRWLVPVRATTMNRQWLDSVRTARQAVVAPDALERMRVLVEEPLSGGGDAPLVTWDGGTLSPDQARLWVAVLTPPERAVLPGLPDSALAMLVGEIADRYIVRDIAQGGSTLPAEAWQTMAPQFGAAYASLDSAYRPVLVGPDSNAVVRDYIRGITVGTIPYRPLPGAMVWLLRQGATITLDRPAIDAIITTVRPAWVAHHDSLAAAARDSAERARAAP
jgi:hypothetical protein